MIMDSYAKWNDWVWFHLYIQTKTNPNSNTYHAMDDTMINLKITYSGPMSPNDDKTCKSSKPNQMA